METEFLVCWEQASSANWDTFVSNPVRHLAGAMDKLESVRSAPLNIPPKSAVPPTGVTSQNMTVTAHCLAAEKSL